MEGADQREWDIYKNWRQVWRGWRRTMNETEEEGEGIPAKCGRWKTRHTAKQINWNKRYVGDKTDKIEIKQIRCWKLHMEYWRQETRGDGDKTDKMLEIKQMKCSRRELQRIKMSQWARQTRNRLHTQSYSLSSNVSIIPVMDIK